MIKLFQNSVSRIRNSALWRYASPKVKAVLCRYGGYMMLVAGILMILFGPKIVDPFLLRILGPKIIFGKQNVIFEGDIYLTTNQAAVIKWIFMVMFIGLILAVGGFFIIQLKKLKKLYDEYILKMDPDIPLPSKLNIYLAVCKQLFIKEKEDDPDES